MASNEILLYGYECPEPKCKVKVDSPDESATLVCSYHFKQLQRTKFVPTLHWFDEESNEFLPIPPEL